MLKNKNVALTVIIIAILVAAFGARKLVDRYVDLRGSQPIEIHDDGGEHGHAPGVPEEHAHE